MNPKTVRARTTRGSLNMSNSSKDVRSHKNSPLSKLPAESNLMKSESYLREMMKNIQLIAVMLDLKGCVTFCNGFLLQVTGYTQDEVLGCDWFTQFVPDFRPDVKELFLQSLARGEIAAQYENPIRTKNGGERFITGFRCVHTES